MALIELFNSWWKSGSVDPSLAPTYRREMFKSVFSHITNRNINLILLISGLRRVGKSTIMYQAIKRLIEAGVNPLNILYYSFDQKEEELLKILEEYGSITGIDWQHEKIYVFFDEIQKLESWGPGLKIIYDRFKNIRIIVSGSGSFRLEKEALSTLAGRYLLVKANPLKFSEFLDMKGSRIDLKKAKLWDTEINKEFMNYLYRPFPALVNVEDIGIVKAVIKENVIDKVLKEDIPSIFKEVNPQLLLSLLDLFYGKPGMYINYDDLSKDIRVSKKTLMVHVYYMEFAYLIRKIKNYRPSSKTVSRKLQRIYPYHWGLLFGWNGIVDWETVAASMLNAKYYWREEGKEADFIIKNKGITPIEVKEKDDLDNDDIAKMAGILKILEVEKGVFVYSGKEGILHHGDSRIEKARMPLIEISHRELIQEEE